jgi:hypothetical protein
MADATAASNALVKEYVALMAPALSDVATFVTLFPWASDGTPSMPDGVIAISNTKSSSLSRAQISVIESKQGAIMIPCTFDNEEEKVLRAILNPLIALEDLCIIILHVMPKDKKITREEMGLIMERHTVMTGLGVDDVFMNPSHNPAIMRRTINLTVDERDVTCKRMRRMLDSSCEEDIAPEETKKLMDRKIASSGRAFRTR